MLKPFCAAYALVLHAALFVAFGRVLGRQSPAPPRAP